MRLKNGVKAPDFSVKSVFGEEFKLSKKREKILLLSFYRYASCPVCNMRINSLIKNFNEYEKYLEVVAVFQSPEENIVKYVGKQDIPFKVISDSNMLLYKKYKVESSWIGFIKACFLRLPVILKAIFVKGYLPGAIDGDMNRIPADFLIDKDNTIIEAYYGKDIGDHIPIKDVLRGCEVE